MAMEKRSCFYRFGCANDGEDDDDDERAFDSIRFDSMTFRSISKCRDASSRIERDFERENTRSRRAKTKDRSSPSVVVTRPRRGKVVSIPLRVIFVSSSNALIDLSRPNERDRIARAKTNETRSKRDQVRGQRILSVDDERATMSAFEHQ